MEDIDDQISKGLYFQETKNRWVADFTFARKRYRKTFSVEILGCIAARELAQSWRNAEMQKHVQTVQQGI